MRDPARRGAWRRIVLSGAMLTVALLGTAYLVFWSPGGAGGDDPARTAPADRTASPTPTGTPTSTPSSTPTTPEPVLTAPGDFPTEGTGEFRYADGEGPEQGKDGWLLRYRVAVERGIEEDVDGVADFVEETLGDSRGWTASGQYRFQRVPPDGSYDVTVHLATSATAAAMCASGGVDVIGSGLPEGGVSCRYSGMVVLNLSRWQQSVPDYVEDRVPLEVYRRMLVNHEMGHAVGRGHQGCPGSGETAPVMLQQSISLDGCVANAWPYPDE